MSIIDEMGTMLRNLCEHSEPTATGIALGLRLALRYPEYAAGLIALEDAAVEPEMVTELERALPNIMRRWPVQVER